MTRPASPPLLAELRDPSSISAQVAALRALKNEIIGHEQRKESWINLGVVPPVVRILTSARARGKAASSRDGNGMSRDGQGIVHDSFGDAQDEARLQATIVVGSLAQGGPAFVAPLLSAGVIPPLLATLAPGEASPQLLLATLRALDSIAQSLPSDYPGVGLSDASLPSLLCGRRNAENIAAILSQTSSASIIQEQIALTASIIAKSCREDRHRAALARHHVLDALAARLASFIVATGFILSTAEPSADRPHATEAIPPPAPSRAQLAPILEAIAVIIQHSKYRTLQLLFSPAMVAVFPPSSLDPVAKAAWGFALTPRTAHLNPIDQLLPQLPGYYSKSSSPQSAAFPPLGSSRFSRTSSATNLASELGSSNERALAEDIDSPLVAWLVHVARAEGGRIRVMAAWVLSILCRSGFAHKRREASLALLIVPLLVRILKDECDKLDVTQSPDACDGWAVIERAPLVLALLVMDSPDLQKAADDADAIKVLAQLLKKTFEAVPSSTRPAYWSANPTETQYASSSVEALSSNNLGPAGVSPMVTHLMRCRAGALSALAAISPFKDEYRKKIIDNGVVPYIIDSLKPLEPGAAGVSDGISTTSAGNPPSVLLAACSAARALSRSVSVLRTSLIDNGIATPLFSLLRHHNIEVQISATAVICNLVIEFSPMRETILDAGVLHILCQQAHSPSAKLRLNAVWALKHLVFSAPNDVKMSCVRELGPSWLIQLITEETDDFGNYGEEFRPSTPRTPLGMGSSNAAGEQVDLLNSTEPERPCAGDEYEGDLTMTDSIGSLSRSSRPDVSLETNGANSSSRLGTAPSTTENIKARLAVIKDDELDPVQQARRDDIAVQEQGLDLIRNLICGPGAPEMIDFLFSTLGQDQMFHIFESKLRPRVVDGDNQRADRTGARAQRAASAGTTTTYPQYRIGNIAVSASSSSSSPSFSQPPQNANQNQTSGKSIPPTPEIILAVCFVLVHIAAGQPRHRQILISQSDLMSELVPLFNHPNRHIRAACAWIVINLTWVDDTSDQMNGRARALELKNLGIESRLRGMESDPELDVRERVKTALAQLGSLLR
ncbi:ARM repeat-containing protein [Xylona heveae TC161]|uniref:ARM repeat-containing protein n=1 Tax=Xylona heveae (strain CBS 132557 / TC161) TaxID=1328760 RepID=A0A165F987_XYLHT|nr:ARM repeat-containing protein [Xylona heveae TC161]KZF20726.1 ARM repeat-containing protein [Xylona heveae TC161]